MNRKPFLAAAAFLALVPALSAQPARETILQSYERIFIRSALSTKANVLSDAAHDESAAEFYGPLCVLALDFVTHNARLFRDDPDMINIAIAAARGVGKYAYTPATDLLWRVFLRFPDNVIRYEILDVLPVMDTASLTAQINEFLAEQNQHYNSGMAFDHRLLVPLFTVLGNTGDESSYPVLLAASRLYTNEIREEAVNALYAIDGDFFGFCLEVMLDKPPPEKLAVFTTVRSREALSAEQKGALAEAALETALAFPGGRQPEIPALTEASLKLISDTQWVRSLPQVLKYYNQSITAFRSDLSRGKPLLNAIDCLGFLTSAEAAEALALQLGLYNSRATVLEKEEQDVVLALIQALGRLGYKASYDTLYYASVLGYPWAIKEAARNSLALLKW